MKNLQRYIGINLALLVVYTAICKIIDRGDTGGLGYAIFMMLLVATQTFVNFIMAMAQFGQGDKENGKTLLLCAGVVLVVGFSACLGGASL